MKVSWTQKEREAWAWPESLKPSEWAEKFRMLPPQLTAEPGPWRNERTPYLVGVMDAISESGAEEIVVLKAAQVGFSECLRNLLGYWICREPGPCLVVAPDQKSADDLVEERLRPLLEHTPAVTRQVTSRAWDVKKTAIRLATMSIYLGWAGSSQALKSRPIRYLICDEIDEFPSVSGAGGDPISKAMKRVTTYAAKGRARVIIGGTPTTRLGNAWRAWEACSDQRHYWVPCPSCGRYQKLEWARVRYADRIEGESRTVHAARVRDTDAAWYECANCEERITEAQKSTMLRRGLWAGSDQVVTPDGRIAGRASKHRRIGFCLPATYSPWVTFSKLASEWIEAQDDPQALADFVNQRLAEPFEEQRAKTAPNFIADKAKGAGSPGIVPSWARIVIATADTQGTDEATGYFWYVIRAWGYDYRSHLIDFGVASSKDELRQRTLDKSFTIEGTDSVVQPVGLWPDSGGPRWSEVYQIAQADNRVHPTKGSAHKRTWMVEERPQKKHAVVLWEIDTEQAKDLLHRLIHDPDRTKWLPHSQITPDYCAQMCAESKIFNPTARREEWVEIVKNNNHLWDCETIQCAVAWRLGCGMPNPKPVAPSEASTEGSPLSYKGRW